VYSAVRTLMSTGVCERQRAAVGSACIALDSKRGLIRRRRCKRPLVIDTRNATTPKLKGMLLGHESSPPAVSVTHLAVVAPQVAHVLRRVGIVEPHAHPVDGGKQVAAVCKRRIPEMMGGHLWGEAGVRVGCGWTGSLGSVRSSSTAAY